MSAVPERPTPDAPHRDGLGVAGMAWLDTWRLGLRAGRSRRAAAASAREGLRFVDLPACSMRVRVSGTPHAGRPTVVLVCDPPSVIEHYDALIELLEPGARVVCLEPPGFGFSVPRRPFDFSFEGYRAAIEALLLALDEGPYLLAFSCVWAHVALQIATRRPPLVAKLLLWQCPAWEQQVAWARQVDARRILSTPLLGQLASALCTRQIGVGWYRSAMARHRHRDFSPQLETALKQGAFCCLGSLWQHFYRTPPPAVHVTQPVLLTWGAADRTHRDSDRTSIARDLPGVALHDGFEYAGHSPELEDSGAFARLLLDWLERPHA